MTKETVLVTGSSRGIGLAIAEKYATAGHNVVLNCAHTVSAMDSAVATLQSLNPNVIGIQADVSDYAQIAAMQNRVTEIFGDVTVLINNAGISFFGLLTDMRPDDWRRVMDVNLGAVLNSCHIFAPHMIKAKKGSIINISSIFGHTGASCEAVYAASKGGLDAFTKSLAKELAPSGVRVNAIACGLINTQMNDRLTAAERRAMMDAIPMGRYGEAAEIAEIAYFLSSQAAGYVTGQIIAVDGGMV